MFLFKTRVFWPFPSSLVQEARLAPLSSGYLARSRTQRAPPALGMQSPFPRPHSAASERAACPPAPSSGRTEQEPREGLDRPHPSPSP